MKTIRVGIVGTKFMGRAHSNAYMDVAQFFPIPVLPVRRSACGLDEASLKSFADKFGWETTETSWQRLVDRDDIDLIDISTSNATHMPIALAAAKRRKNILCEKPLALNAKEARKMLDAAQEGGITHMVAFNYRRVPALALAKQLIEQGKIGRVYHFNAVYYQDWLVDPNFPFTWRHDARTSGSGAHGDLNAHIIDLARFLIGEFSAVSGDQEVFIKERRGADGAMGKISVDDATSFLAHFQSGALGSFLATRFATGRKNVLRLEIFGSQGSLNFNLERLNELEYYSLNDDSCEQGFRNILVTEKKHPFMNAWWPAGHIIGWEHTFIHEIADLLTAIDASQQVVPDFYDGLRCQQVLDAVVESAKNRKWVEIPEA
jgi:predicted dehydrogenase